MEGRDLMPVCEACNGVGWILANTGECHEEIQRCDACEVHPGDGEAWSALMQAITDAKDMVTHEGHKKHLDGLMEIVKLFSPRMPNNPKGTG